MIATEAAMLCRLAKVYCPQQAFDEYSADGWHDLLEPYRFVDCKEALVNITRTRPFVAPSEIIAEVKRIRARRLDEHPPFDPPPEVEDYNRWLGEMRKRIADGETITDTRPELAPRDMKAIRGVFRDVRDETAHPTHAHPEPEPLITTEHRAAAEAFFASTPEPEGDLDDVIEAARREQYERVTNPEPQPETSNESEA